MYSDKELKEFTQIAYRDFEGANDIYGGKNDPGRVSDAEPQPIQNLVDQAIAKDPNSMDALDMSVIDSHPEWKMVATFDDNANSGYYACLIETEPGHLVIAFRGSESLFNLHNLKTDWGAADFGLLGSVETSQHEQVRRMFESQEFQDILARYDHVTMTGHSLGGNLAEYATVMSVKYHFDDKVDQCVSFDGPGFSDEFIEKYRSEIDKVSGKMTHYQWSIVGALENMLPGVAFHHVAVKDPWTPFLRHSTEGLIFDENGNLVPGRYTLTDILALRGRNLSLLLEKYVFGENTGRNLLNLGLQMTVLSFGGALAFTMVYDAAKTAYKQLSKLIQSIIHRDADFFRVDTAALSRDAGSVRSSIDRVRKNVNEMFASVQGLNGMWTGNANKAFTAKFVAEKQDIDRYLDQIERYVTRIENDASAYANCENRAIGMI